MILKQPKTPWQQLNQIFLGRDHLECKPCDPNLSAVSTFRQK